MAPNPYFTLKIEDQTSRELYMSFGLLNQLIKVIGDMSNLHLIYTDPDVQELIVGLLVQERTKAGKIIDDKIVELDELALDPTHVTEIVAWAGSHLSDFFLRNLGGVKNLTEEQQGAIKALVSSLNGDANFLSKIQSV